MWHFWYVEEFAVPNRWMFNMGVVVASMGALAYVVHVHALVELGAETPGENPLLQKCTRWPQDGSCPVHPIEKRML